MFLKTCFRFLVQPFDVLKIRYQLQVEEKHLAKYRSIGCIVKLMAKEEGMSSFWKGHMTAQYLSVIYMAIQVHCYKNICSRKCRDYIIVL